MNTSSISRFVGIAAVAMMVLPITASAQGMGGQYGYGQAPPPPMFGGQGRDQGQRPPRPSELTPASIPVSTLVSALKLTDDQRVKIAAIQARFDSVRRVLMPMQDQMSNRPRPGAGQGGGPGLGGPQGQGFGGPSGPNGFGGPPQGGGFGGPGRGGPGMGADEVEDMNADASDKIVAVLTDQQQASLTKLMHNLRDLRLVGIAPESYADLNLTSSQLDKIAVLASAHRDDVLKAVSDNQDPASVQSAMQSLRRKLHADALALLTDDQAAIVKAQHPDGPGGAGGPGGFGQDGPRFGQRAPNDPQMDPGGNYGGPGSGWGAGPGGPGGGQLSGPAGFGVPGPPSGQNGQSLGGPAPGL